MSQKSANYDALIIGASGGIGHALAEELSGDTDLNCLHMTAFQNQNRLPDAVGSSAVYQLDITDRRSINAFITELQHRASNLRLIINAAGVLHGQDLMPERRLADLSLENLQTVFSQNCFGHAMLLSALQPLLPRQGVTRIASLSARVGSITDNRLGGWYAYRASKAALNQIIKSASIELKRLNPEMVCIALHPGTVDTRLSDPFTAGIPDQKLFSPEFSAQRLLRVLMNSSPLDNGNFFAWDGTHIPF